MIFILVLALGAAAVAAPVTIEGRFDGADGSAWPDQWIVPQAGQTFNIENNRGVVRHQGGGGPNAIALEPAIEGRTAYALNSVQQVRLMAPVSTSGVRGGLIARQHDTAPGSFYSATLSVSHGAGRLVTINRRVRGREEAVATLGRGEFWEIGREYMLRFSVEQVDERTTRLRAKYWPADQAEPAGWQLDAVDRHPALQQVIGRVGLFASTSSSSARRWYFDRYQVTAPFIEESEMQAPKPRLTLLPAPGARSVVMSAEHRLAVVGHTFSGGHLTVFRLDHDGAPAGTPLKVTLPRPDRLREGANYPLSMAWHPTQPLLYVWQDFDGERGGDREAAEFDHLIVYRVRAGELVHVGSFARGARFAYGLNEGSIAVDAANNRLYVPNLRGRDNLLSVGYLHLGEDGLPIAEGERAEPVRIEVLASTRRLPRDFRGSAGWGFVPGSEHAVIFAAYDGLVTWDQHPSRPMLGWLPLPESPSYIQVEGHPGLPLVFAAGWDSQMLYRVQHARGYLTLLPEPMSVSGASFRSAPVVMAGRDQLAIGDVNRVVIVTLDREAAFTRTFSMHPVANPSVRAMAYSEWFDRLYVPVERVE